MANTGIKRRRIHVSKNKKKSWNKYSDIKDIDDFLEEKRREEILGGDVKQKANEQLFFISGADDLSPGISKKKDKKNRPLRCFQALSNCSKVAIPVTQNCGVIGRKQKNRISKVLDKKLKNIEASKQSTQQKNLAPTSRSFYNLWDEEKKDSDEEIIQKKKLKVPRYRYQKPSLLPSVEIPHPGSSYNPTYEDHQKLLLEAVLVEQKKEKEEQHLKRVLDDMFPSKEKAPTHETWLQEMSQGLFEENSNEDMDNQDEGLVEVGNPPVHAGDRKTKSQKRKKKMIKQEDHRRKLAKADEKRIREVYRLQAIKTAIKEMVKKSEEKQREKDKREMEKMYNPQTLSRYKYEPQDLEVNLTEELPESLRTLKVEGDLLEDRYKSLQRRNIIEPRLRQRRKRKYKLKVQVKRSHRDFH